MTGGRLTLDVAERNRIVVAALHGDLDRTTIDLVSGRLLETVENQHHGIVVDLSHVRYMDSSGVAFLLKLSRRVTTQQRELRLIVLDASPLRRTLAVTGVDRVVPVHPDADHALLAMTDDP